MRYLLTFSYDGTKFHGFQRQNNVKNVQGALEQVLSEILKERIVIKGSGRTDAGVHALNQKAHFDYEKKLPKNLKVQLNKYLNKEIVIKKVDQVHEDFHARHSAIKKIYTYKIYMGHNFNKEGYYYHIRYPVDLKEMKKVAKLMEGTHDFRNFVSGDRIDYTSTIYKIIIKKYFNYLTITFVGVGFYRYMVRHLVGALLDVGRNHADIKRVENMLDNENFVNKLGIVPAQGLYLVNVFYKKL